jgi:hypothetical protein
MTHLQGEKLEEALKDWEEIHAKDDAWLVSRGWAKTENGWMDPNGKQHQTIDAVDHAENDLLTELGWLRISTRQLYPDFKGGKVFRYLEQRDNYHSDNDSVWLEPGDTRKPAVWCHYVHPVSGRIYFWWDAIAVARYYNNNEQACWAENSMCGKSEQMQKALGDIQLTEDDVLWIKFIPQENGPAVWHLDHIEKNGENHVS